MNRLLIFGILYVTITNAAPQQAAQNNQPTNDVSISTGSYSYTDANGNTQQIAYTKDKTGYHINSSNIPEKDIPKIIAEIEKQSTFVPIYFPSFNNPYFPFFNFQQNRQSRSRKKRLFVSAIRQPIPLGVEDAPFISMIDSKIRASDDVKVPDGTLFVSDLTLDSRQHGINAVGVTEMKTEEVTIEANKMAMDDLVTIEADTSTDKIQFQAVDQRNEQETKLPIKVDEFTTAKPKTKVPVPVTSDMDSKANMQTMKGKLPVKPYDAGTAWYPQPATEPSRDYVYYVENPYPEPTYEPIAYPEPEPNSIHRAVYTAKLHKLIYEYIQSLLQSQ